MSLSNASAAAHCRISIKPSAHLTIDVPAAATVLEPKVPVPFGASLVSPAISEIDEGSRPSFEDRI